VKSGVVLLNSSEIELGQLIGRDLAVSDHRGQLAGRRKRSCGHRHALRMSRRRHAVKRRSSLVTQCRRRRDARRAMCGKDARRVRCQRHRRLALFRGLEAADCPESKLGESGLPIFRSETPAAPFSGSWAPLVRSSGPRASHHCRKCSVVRRRCWPLRLRSSMSGSSARRTPD
jgi:hypothetical protein